jgi:hypothetical protein
MMMTMRMKSLHVAGHALILTMMMRMSALLDQAAVGRLNLRTMMSLRRSPVAAI